MSSVSYPIKKNINDRGHINTQAQEDVIALEAPLILRYSYSDSPETMHNLATLLRTPTNDYYLTCGFLFAEGYFSSPQEISMYHYCDQDDAITIVSDKELSIVERPHLTHSGCGSCALEVIDNLYQHLRVPAPWTPSNDFLFQLIDLPKSQPLFQQSGGTHATLIFDENGNLISEDEDVGRHNALDKAIGKLWCEQKLARAKIAWVSGRIGFELVQKCINAGIPNIISVGAPTSLSIDYAKKYGIGLYAFARDNSFNKYS